jgi:hypothetical protein
MRETLTRVIHRDVKLGDLEDKSEKLVEDTDRFKHTSKTLRKRVWWQKTKWSALLATVLLVTVGLVVVLAVLL